MLNQLQPLVFSCIKLPAPTTETQKAPCPPCARKQLTLPCCGRESKVRIGDQQIAGSPPSFPLLRGAFLAVCDNLHPMHNGNYRPGLIFGNSNRADQVSGMHFKDWNKISLSRYLL